MGCADVCLDMDYDVSNEFYAEKMCVARKEHRCCECGGAIAKGATYQRASGKSDGCFFAESTCALCTEIRGAFVCGSWIFGMLHETIREKMFPLWNAVGPYDCLAELESVEARAMLNERYRQWTEERT